MTTEDVDPGAGAAPIQPRFVVQAHDAPPLHYDLMLEWGAVLATWETAQPPTAEQGPQAVAPKPDHRREYLSYEGPISDGRGTTSIWDRGHYEARRTPAGVMFLRLSGAKTNGWFALNQREGSWQLLPTPESELPADAAPVAVEVQRDAAPAAGAPAGAPEQPEAKAKAARQPRKEKPMRRSTKVMLLMSVVVFGAGIAFLAMRAHYRSRFRAQAYVQILITYRDIGREKDQAEAIAMEEQLDERLKGQEIEIIGRVGAIEPITEREGVTHPGGVPVRLWIDVPNVVEPANATRKDVACVIPHAQLDEPAVAGGDPNAPATPVGAHTHRYMRGDLVRVRGRLTKYVVASNGSRASLEVRDANIVPMSGIEEHFFRAEARTLGPMPQLKGITDPYRDRRDAMGKIK